MKINRLLLTIFCGIILQSCIKKTDIIPPEVEISAIYNVTDTSASFEVIVTHQSNAQWDSFYEIWVDTSTISINSFPPNNSYLSPLEKDTMQTTISELKNSSHYFARVHYEGVFDIGGPNERKRFLLGEEKEFTTLP